MAKLWKTRMKADNFKSVYVLVLYLLFSLAVKSQSNLLSLNTGIQFYTIPKNFEYNGVLCIYKDYLGYMWFGTTDGLIRYDGINLYLYEHDPSDSTSISHNSINAIVEDADNNLWIGTNIGLNLFNREKNNFIHLGNYGEHLVRLNTNFVGALYFDKESRLWVGTFGDGVNVLNTENYTLKHYSYIADDSTSLSSNRITCIIEDIKGNIWLGSQNGLNLYDRGTETFRQFLASKNNINSLSHNNISSFLLDKKGTLWIGTEGGGVNKLISRDGNYIFHHYTEDSRSGSISNNSVLSMTTGGNENIWIGTENGGLNHFNIVTEECEVFKVIEGYDYSLTSNSIWALCTDNEGRIWIGTDNKGINVIDQKFNKFRSVRKNVFSSLSLTDNDVTGFAEDSDGIIWIATDGGGICKFDPEKNEIIETILNSDKASNLANNAIKDIVFDINNYLWVGTWSGGIDLLNNKGKRIKNYSLQNEKGVGSNDILCLFVDSEGDIWAGTAGSGLFLYNATNDTFVQLNFDKESLLLTSTSYISDILEDSNGDYWIGTVNGLAKLEVKSDRHFICTDIPSINEGGINYRNMIVDIYEDSKGGLWVGTTDHGLNYLDWSENKLIPLKKEDEFPSNAVNGIIEDNSGDLWITTRKGLVRFNIDNLSFKIYNSEDGLNSNEFYARSCIKTRDGQLFIGSENGINFFNPQNIVNNSFIPPVYLTNLKINNIPVNIGEKNSPLKKHISETERITLTSRQSSFTLEFVALNYTRTSKNQYVYKLAGFSEDWTYSGNNTSVSYTNIPSGNYTFLVKGSNNDGIWNPDPAILRIRIKPPFWKSWQAILIYVVLIFLLLVVSLKIWIERVNIKHRLQLERLGREKEHELNERNLQFLTNISHEFRTPLSLIIGPLESIISSTKSNISEQLTVIYRNAQRLLYLTNNLMDFRKLEEGLTKLNVKNGDIISYISDVSSYFNIRSTRRNIDYCVKSAESFIKGWFDPDKMETILLNLLSNSFKNTPDNGEIQIVINVLDKDELIRRNYGIDNFQQDCRYIEISVIDNGTGIVNEEIDLVFDKYYQSKSSKNKINKGTGIGLALVKGLVELHHGSIVVESVPDKETTFRFVLPIDRIAYKETEVTSEPINILKRTVTQVPREIGNLKGNSDNQKKPVKEPERPNILLVEDNDELRTFLVKELNKEFNIEQAENGKIGIELALDQIPDLIVSDILMPERNGIELCSELKNDIRTCHIPIILLTAKSTINDQIEGVKIGADAYIVKPFNIQYLIAKINQLIHSRNKLYAHFSQDVYIIPDKLTNNKKDQEFLQKVIDYVISHIEDNKLSVEGLAESMYLSRSVVYRKIKALTGSSIIDFIRTIRLKQAIKLMESKKYSLAEVAYLTGFTSPSYFTKCFRDQYGKPPSDFL